VYYDNCVIVIKNKNLNLQWRKKQPISGWTKREKNSQVSAMENFRQYRQNLQKIAVKFSWDITITFCIKFKFLMTTDL